MDKQEKTGWGIVALAILLLLWLSGRLNLIHSTEVVTVSIGGQPVAGAVDGSCTYGPCGGA